MLIVNIPFVGVSLIPGPELGFNMFYKDYYIERNYYFPDDQLLIMKSVNSRKAEQKAIDRINNTIESGCDLLFFGGNHATTAYIYEEILYKKDIPIIIFDAHNDKGDKTDTYYNWNIINYLEKHVPEGCVFGYRNQNNDMPFSDIFTYMTDVDMLKLDYMDEYIRNWCKNKDRIYVSIDVDVINPVDFPGVGFPVAGGLNLTQLLFYISLIRKYSNQIIWDIVEFNPLIEKTISERALERLLLWITK